MKSRILAGTLLTALIATGCVRIGEPGAPGDPLLDPTATLGSEARLATAHRLCREHGGGETADTVPMTIAERVAAATVIAEVRLREVDPPLWNTEGGEAPPGGYDEDSGTSIISRLAVVGVERYLKRDGEAMEGYVTLDWGGEIDGRPYWLGQPFGFEPGVSGIVFFSNLPEFEEPFVDRIRARAAELTEAGRPYEAVFVSDWFGCSEAGTKVSDSYDDTVTWDIDALLAEIESAVAALEAGTPAVEEWRVSDGIEGQALDWRGEGSAATIEIRALANEAALAPLREQLDSEFFYSWLQLNVRAQLPIDDSPAALGCDLLRQDGRRLDHEELSWLSKDGRYAGRVSKGLDHGHLLVFRDREGFSSCPAGAPCELTYTLSCEQEVAGPIEGLSIDVLSGISGHSAGGAPPGAEVSVSLR